MPSPWRVTAAGPSSSSNKEDRGALAARDRGRDVLQHQQRFSGAGRTKHQGARPCGDAATEQRVELGKALVSTSTA
jgi:hypothetical protein